MTVSFELNAKLYAEREAFLKENEAIKAENARFREVLSDPSVDEETLNAFDEALDARLRAANAEAIRRSDRHREYIELTDEAMRLFKEVRRLQGIQ